jgi:hypothetical protein
MSHDQAVPLTNPTFSNTCHQLYDIFAMTVSVEICGADGWEDITPDNQAQAGWFGP